MDLFRLLGCLFGVHSWEYVCSFTKGEGPYETPYGGIRITCERCGRRAVVHYKR